MSANTTTPQVRRLAAPIDPEGAHYVRTKDMEVANELGVQVQAVCGYWDFLDRIEGTGRYVASGGICRRCAQIYAAAEGPAS